jgi:hypothetical protein
MEKKIVRSNGSEYMTVATVGDMIEFRNFSSKNITIRFDAKTLDQLIPFLTEVNFWNKAKEKKNETSD